MNSLIKKGYSKPNLMESIPLVGDLLKCLFDQEFFYKISSIGFKFHKMQSFGKCLY